MKILSVFIMLMTLVNARVMSQFKAPASSEEWLACKSYYATYLLLKDTSFAQRLFRDANMQKALDARQQRLRAAAGTGNRDLLSAFKWSDSELRDIPLQLVRVIVADGASAKAYISELQSSGRYARGKENTADFMAEALKKDMLAANYALDVYAGGTKPNYPNIDSLSLNVKSSEYGIILREVLYDLQEDIAKDGTSYFATMRAAIRFLEINDRWDASLLEPLTEGENSKAYHAVAGTDFKRYPYSLILVLGAGPEQRDVKVSPLGMITCRKAAKQYFEGLAPFILLSGGRVHPYKTKYIESLEMKRYMMEVLGVPEEALLIDPQARHTTTNLRNAARILLGYGFPAGKKSLITSRAFHIASVDKMEARCMRELGYVPYVLGKRIDDRSVEFLPRHESLRIDQDEPLDP